ncbi:DUF6624 domain-containing protein [Nonomuraea sp. NPDC050310]|uniref:DUF6624 domain-containing protein n=1 Tax=Nonomuraea sp. NPDC050310 TaxID=3154935 RepID=UPI0033D60C26
MRILPLCLLALLLALTACGGEEELPPPSNPQLRAELLRLLDKDQKQRTDTASPEQFDRVEKENTARLEQILDQYGWPGWKLVGKDGSSAAWALAQHADQRLDVQKRALALLKTAVEQGDASKGDLAYLTDRVRVAERKPQVYGTQIELGPDGAPRPQIGLENEAEVDKRRAEAGLKPLKEYYAEFKSGG